MIQNSFSRVIFSVCLFILVFISTAFFEMAFAFLGIISRFIASFLLNIVLAYYCARFLDISKKTRILIAIIFPLLSILPIVALGIMQQSHRGFRVFFPF